MHRLLIILMVVAVAGCESVTLERHADGPVPVTLRVDDAAYWLEEWDRVRALPADQVRQTLKTREQEFSGHPDPRTRLRLALLLAEGPPAVRDQLRALHLLGEMGKGGEGLSASARALAALLEQVIREQLDASDRVDKLDRDLADADERVKELERQLQELTNIEQSIQQRAAPVERKEK